MYFFFQTKKKKSFIELETRLFTGEKATDCPSGAGARVTRHWEWTAEIQVCTRTWETFFSSFQINILFILSSYALMAKEDLLYLVLHTLFQRIMSRETDQILRKTNPVYMKMQPVSCILRGPMRGQNPLSRNRNKIACP